jgi:hypothetical protein
MILLILIAALALVAIIATAVSVLRDGYRRAPFPTARNLVA